MGLYLLIAARNLLQARRRTALLSTALAIVSMLLVLLMTLSQGLSDTMLHSATMLMTGHVNIGGYFKSKNGAVAPLITNTAQLRKLVASEVPGVDHVIDRARGYCRIVSETEALGVVLAGIDVDEEADLLQTLRPANERTYRDDGVDAPVGDARGLRQPDSIVLFAGQAKRLQVRINDVVTLMSLTLDGTSNTFDARIVAIAQDVGFISNYTAFVPKGVVRTLSHLSDDVSGAVMIYLKDPGQAGPVMQHLRQVLEAQHFALLEHDARPFFLKSENLGGEDWQGEHFDLTTWEDEVGAMRWSLNALNSISVFLLGVLTLMIVVGITNSMYIAVRERTQEVGTLRAIGMGRRRILAMFMTEAVLLGFAATTLGSVLGAVIAITVNALSLKVSINAVRMILMSDTVHLSVNVMQIVSAVVAFTAITVLASLWPALRAARMQPITAIHQLG